MIMPGASLMIEEDDRCAAELASLFRATRELMDGTAGPIERLIEQGDVVYGVWLDKTKPTGIDFEVLKGIEVLEKRRASGVHKTVVPCGSREQAIMIRTMFCH
jgi:hypothetical protein